MASPRRKSKGNSFRWRHIQEKPPQSGGQKKDRTRQRAGTRQRRKRMRGTGVCNRDERWWGRVVHGGAGPVQGYDPSSSLNVPVAHGNRSHL